MIDLDDLEVRCTDGQKWLHDWYDGGGAPTPETAAALVRAVRASRDFVLAHDRAREQSIFVWPNSEWDDLLQALVPYVPPSQP